MDGTESDHSAQLRQVGLVHGLFWIVTGFWPLLDLRTFQFVTGSKRDLWLVKVAGALIGVIGTVLALSSVKDRVTPELRILGIGSALSLTSIDLVYVRRGTISRVYPGDAGAELGLAAWWLRTWMPLARVKGS